MGGAKIQVVVMVVMPVMVMLVVVMFVIIAVMVAVIVAMAQDKDGGPVDDQTDYGNQTKCEHATSPPVGEEANSNASALQVA